eukprot:Clim_evm2s94 gene=Clim_evmTU2s94
MNSPGKVVVIGAGVAGIAAMKHFSDDGFEVVAYEGSDSFGGVWHNSAYCDLRTNNPWPTYHLCDLSMPKPANDEVTISQKEMMDYFNKYVDKFELRRRIRLGRFVTRVERECGSQSSSPSLPSGTSSSSLNSSTSRWIITHCDAQTWGDEQVEYADFVYVSTGTFSQPNLPKIKGSDIVGAPQLIHSTEVRSPDQVKNKKVLVVGAGKSAQDLIVYCCTVNAGNEQYKPTINFRTMGWAVPNSLFGLSGERIIMTCATESTYDWPVGPGQPAWKKFLQKTSLGRKCKETFWHAISEEMKKPYLKEDGTYAPCCPEGEILPQIHGIGSPAREWFKLCKQEVWNVKKGVQIESFGPESGQVNFSDGTSDKFDVVVAATGFLTSYPFLDNELCLELGVPTTEKKDNVTNVHPINCGKQWRLYNLTMPPSDPTICFGLTGWSMTSCHYADVNAMWVSDLWRGKLPQISSCATNLKKQAQLRKEIEERVEYTRYLELGRGDSGLYVVGASLLIKDMLTEMRINVPTQSNAISEWFGKFTVDRISTMKHYRSLRDKLEKEGKPFARPGMYLSFAWLGMLAVIVFSVLAAGVI